MSGALIRATPFHTRAADANRLNAWETRNGWTLARAYGDFEEEALAARRTASMADISWRWRIAIEGARAEEFLSRLLTRDASALSPGTAFKALWLTDKGGLRGAGLVARFGRESFLLAAYAPDAEWIMSAAALFEVRVRDVSEEEGGLSIVGPFARKIVEAAGLDASVEPLAFRKLFWRGLDVTLSRWGEHGGYELWCNADDAFIAWDNIARAGEPFGLRLAGLQAQDILDLEAGVPRPARDYDPARDGFAEAPSPRMLGLDGLIDPTHPFNGRAAYLGSVSKTICVGVELDSETPAPNAPLLLNGRSVGHTLGSLYSPALRRAIALATVDSAAAALGTKLSLAPASTALVCALPFLPPPTEIR